MRELPEELSVELLSLVLNKKVVDFTNVQMISGVFCDYMEIKIAAQIEPENILIEDCINTDTLTILMKEWCNSHSYDVLTCLLSNNKSWCQLVEMKTDTFKGISQYFHSKTEFEAVLKATHWVAKEKGLI